MGGLPLVAVVFYFFINFVHFDWLILSGADESLYLMAKRLCDTHFIKFV